MSNYPEIAARFAGHEMTVLHDDGLYRHLRFEGTAESSLGRYPSYPFELITWPYNLVVKSGWTFHFDIDATPDMFNLFRKTALSGQINPGYWSEKVRAGRDEVEDYSIDLLKKEIDETVTYWTEELAPGGVLTAEQLRSKVHEHFFGDLGDYNVEYEDEAHRALHDFQVGDHFKATCQCGASKAHEYYTVVTEWRRQHLSALPHRHDEGVDPAPIVHDSGYHFYDWHEWRLKDFTPGFLHSCYAIRHGIDLWDAARKQVAA
jgi:hypothetical protein